MKSNHVIKPGFVFKTPNHFYVVLKPGNSQYRYQFECAIFALDKKRDSSWIFCKLDLSNLNATIDGSDLNWLEEYFTIITKEEKL